MAPTINSRKRSRQSNPAMPMRPEERKFKEARQAEARQAEAQGVGKKPASTERYSVPNDPQDGGPKEAPKEAPKQVFHRDTITEQNSATSPLLRLPPELRNKIYKLVGQKVTLGRSRKDFSIYGEKDLSLLLTCRQVNHEASSLLPDHQILHLGWGYQGPQLLSLYRRDRKRATKLSIWNITELEIHFTFFGIAGFLNEFDFERYYKHRQSKPDLLLLFPRLQHVEAYGTEGKILEEEGLEWLKDLCCGDSEIKVRITG